MEIDKLQEGIGSLMNSICENLKEVQMNAPLGCFLRRNEIDSLAEKGLWNQEDVTQEYLKIREKKSHLSSNERKFIQSIGDVVYNSLNEE